MRVVERWHGLPRESVGAPSMEIFVLRLDGALCNFIYLEMSLLIAGAGLHDLLKVLPNLNKPGILFYKVHAGLYCLHVLSWAGAGQILTHTQHFVPWWCRTGCGTGSVWERGLLLCTGIFWPTGCDSQG